MRFIIHQMMVLSAIALGIFANDVFAADSTSYDPAASPTTTRTGMTLCSDMVVNGNPRLTPTLTPNTLSTASVCSAQSGGGGGWGGGPILGVLVANLSATCPADRPYLGSVTEGWGGSFGVAGGIGMTVTCCTVPQDTTMSIQTGYSPTGAFNTWQPGPDCL